MQKVKIKENLYQELKSLGFDELVCENFVNEFGGKVFDVLKIWKDEEIDQYFVTIDVCVEIPIQCCEFI